MITLACCYGGKRLRGDRQEDPTAGLGEEGPWWLLMVREGRVLLGLGPNLWTAEGIVAVEIRTLKKLEKMKFKVEQIDLEVEKNKLEMILCTFYIHVMMLDTCVSTLFLQYSTTLCVWDQRSLTTCWEKKRELKSKWVLFKNTSLLFGWCIIKESKCLLCHFLCPVVFLQHMNLQSGGNRRSYGTEQQLKHSCSHIWTGVFASSLHASLLMTQNVSGIKLSY